MQLNHLGCSQSLAANALKCLMDQLEKRILQTDLLKNALKYLQHRVILDNYILDITMQLTRILSVRATCG